MDKYKQFDLDEYRELVAEGKTFRLGISEYNPDTENNPDKYDHNFIDDVLDHTVFHNCIVIHTRGGLDYIVHRECYTVYEVNGDQVGDLLFIFSEDEKQGQQPTDKMDLYKIKQIQLDSEVVLGETLASIPAEGLNMEEAFYLYMQAMHWAEEDRFFRLADGSFEEFDPYEEGGWDISKEMKLTKIE